jgi:hypothetical protein
MFGYALLPLSARERYRWTTYSARLALFRSLHSLTGQKRNG